MAELLHIDDDWKKQAQEEKRRLVEEQQKRQAAPPAAAPPLVAPMGAARSAAPAAKGRRTAREIPAASFSSLVQSILTQALYHLGELAPAGGEAAVNLDVAKHHLDTLGVLEQKTTNNLDETERHMLDAALYEARARFVSIASQYI